MDVLSLSLLLLLTVGERAWQRNNFKLRMLYGSGRLLIVSLQNIDQWRYVSSNFLSSYSHFIFSSLPTHSTTPSSSAIVGDLLLNISFLLTTLVVIGVFVTAVFAGAFAFGIGFDVGVTKFYDSWNKGVRHIGSLTWGMLTQILETMERYQT